MPKKFTRTRLFQAALMCLIVAGFVFVLARLQPTQTSDLERVAGVVGDVERRGPGRWRRAEFRFLLETPAGEVTLVARDVEKHRAVLSSIEPGDALEALAEPDAVGRPIFFALDLRRGSEVLIGFDPEARKALARTAEALAFAVAALGVALAGLSWLLHRRRAGERGGAADVALQLGPVDPGAGR